MKDKNTIELLSILNNVNDEAKLNSFLNENFDINRSLCLGEYIHKIMVDNNLKKSEVVKRSGIQRTYAYQILQGLKTPSRDKVIALCIATGMNFDETHKALTIAGEGILYTKDKRDAIIIFAINNGCTVIKANELLHDMNELPLD